MKVKLKYPHTHAGKDYPAGAEIDVDVLEAIWLKAEDLVHAEWDALKAEVKKLATKDNPTPYADELAAAQAKASAADAALAAVPANSAAAAVLANSAAAQENAK